MEIKPGTNGNDFDLRLTKGESIQIVTDSVNLEVYFLDDGRIAVENWGSGEVVNRISNTPSS